MAESVPRAATLEQISVGMGSSAIILRKKVSPSHARHLKIQDDDVRTELLHLLHRENGIGGNGNIDVAFLESKACMTWRTTAESSTTST